jgi:hypothetical protein
MSFAINPAIDLVMLCARGELKESGPLGFQLIVLNLINSDDKIKTMLKKSCRPENREAPVPVNIAGCKCIRKRTLQTYIILQRNQCLILGSSVAIRCSNPTFSLN